uniref:Uncharacterized protein n=1 Tax=Macrostomum lignano TaxID=282301 RepID=A0A1I8FUN3_9PLAT
MQHALGGLRQRRISTGAERVLTGAVAGYYGYKGRFGYGMRSNFLLTSFLCTSCIRITARYSRNLVKMGSTAMYTGFDEHLISWAAFIPEAVPTFSGVTRQMTSATANCDNK